MKPLRDYNYLKVSELQKMTGRKLARLTQRPLLITERSLPKYLVVPASQAPLQKGDYEYLTSPPSMEKAAVP